MEAMTVRGALELLERGGRVEQRVVVGATPVRIGRAYDNDLIVDDIHVDPHHAEAIVGDDGVPIVRDLSSVNGLHRAGVRNRVDTMPLDRECTFSIGASTIRFRPADYATNAAQPIRNGRLLAHSGLWAVVALALCLAATATEATLGSSESFNGLQLLNAVLAPLIVILVWSAIWALVGRLLVHHARFLGHVAIVSFGIFLGVVITFVLGLFAFSLALDSFATWIGSITAFIAMTIVFSGHLRLATRLRSRGALIAGLCAAVLIAASFRVTHMVGAQRFSPLPRRVATLAPPSWRIRSPESTDTFYAKTQSLVDGLRDEAPLKTTPEK
jgi:FHA domain